MIKLLCVLLGLVQSAIGQPEAKTQRNSLEQGITAAQENIDFYNLKYKKYSGDVIFYLNSITTGIKDPNIRALAAARLLAAQNDFDSAKYYIDLAQKHLTNVVVPYYNSALNYYQLNHWILSYDKSSSGLQELTVINMYLQNADKHLLEGRIKVISVSLLLQ